MKKLNVETPEEWKSGLFLRLEKNKKPVIRPVVFLAACLAAVICLSASAFAVSAVRAPEYFGSLFLGQSETADALYSPKNIVFESSRDDLTLTCKGIAGDSFDVFMLFELASTGDTVFNDESTYYFGEAQHDISSIFPLGSFSRSISVRIIDEKKAEIEICFSASEGGSFLGRDVEFYFENIEVWGKDRDDGTLVAEECEFRGKVRIDYAATLRKMKKNSEVLVSDGVSFIPLKGSISNFNLDIKLKVADGMEIYESTEPEGLVSGTLTLNFKDGTSKAFMLKMPPESDNDAFFSSVGKSDNELSLLIHFPEPVNADAVSSIELNSSCLFTAE